MNEIENPVQSDYFELEETAECAEAVYVLRNGELVMMEVPDDVDDDQA